MERGISKQEAEGEPQENQSDGSGSKDEVLKSKVDPCAKCSRRVMANLVMCTKGGKWVHGSCARMKRVTSTLAKGFVCKLLYVLMQIKELWNQVKKYHFVTRLTL